MILEIVCAATLVGFVSVIFYFLLRHYIYKHGLNKPIVRNSGCVNCVFHEYISSTTPNMDWHKCHAYWEDKYDGITGETDRVYYGCRHNDTGDCFWFEEIEK